MHILFFNSIFYNITNLVIIYFKLKTWILKNLEKFEFENKVS